jgi:hypothetical protein
VADGKAGCEGPALEVTEHQIDEWQFLLAQVLVDKARDTQAIFRQTQAKFAQWLRHQWKWLRRERKRLIAQ